MIDFTSQEWLRQFKAMTPPEQILKIAKLIHTITMLARDTYDMDSDFGVAKPATLRGTNELVQRLSSLAVGIGSGNERDLDSFIDGTFWALENGLTRLKIPKKLL
ncbi:hypothetical protein [Acidovorax sp.]|uniref:hypothetical protein n=1 Tax=Acidovorax sp. TaxID=1872122 RepID=UPI002ACEB173|nr:hypothetical protein [Acidovorax sp.]MDZ7866837.1 hypothetical protein [Acidovorax sp.]